MTLQECLSALEDFGTEQNRKVYPRHGVTTPMFGVSFGNLNTLKKQIKKDHNLALQLWDTRNHDARILATKIADPKAMDAATLERWVRDLDNYIVSDAVADIANKTAGTRSFADAWIESADEWISRCGWMLMAHLAMKDQGLPDNYFSALIQRITHSIHGAKIKTRDAMNNALIAIGLRTEALQAEALAAAGVIGKVEVDHGETSCKTPDAAAYIERALAHRRKKVMGVKK